MSEQQASATAATTSRFETCFAQGLDLSEFSTPQSPAKTTSHSAKLLETTQKRAEERRLNESQEFALALAVQEKSRSFVNAATKPQRPRNDAHAAVLQMHALDKAEPRQRLIKKGPKTLKKNDKSSAKHARKGLVTKTGTRRGR